MPMISPACTKRRVRLMSSWLGDTSPEGWLCAKITLAAACATAVRKTSRGCTMADDRLPMDTISLWIT